MFRPPAIVKPGANSAASSNASGRQAGNSANSPTTIREIRSRTVGSASSNNARQLLANRRQAMSMERLNSNGQVVSSAAIHSHNNSNNNDREKGSPSSGSSNSINGSTTTSPLRNAAGSLNRTASRVSRFRSAKAVFERLSSNNNTQNRLDKPTAPEKPRGTVASRYAAAAAARATTHASNVTTSPRSRLAAGSLARSQDSGRSASNIEIHRFSTNTSSKTDSAHPKPQPRVITNRTTAAHASATTNSSAENSHKNPRLPAAGSTPTKTTTPASQAKPPRKDLIDKIVLEIARDAGKQPPDANCTIQDLSDCNISGIPETLDFDRCFQDVEMMTEEEARKLLSRKSNSSPLPNNMSSEDVDGATKEATDIEANTSKTLADTSSEDKENKIDTGLVNSSNNNLSTMGNDSSIQSSLTETSSANGSSKNKVRFSEEPIKVFSTHAVEDYDRRNDDIDPVAASAEYEIEKSKEREGLQDSDEDDLSKASEALFIQNKSGEDSNILDNPPGILHGLHNVPHSDRRDSSGK